MSAPETLVSPGLLISVAGLAIGSVGLYLTIRRYREDSLRRGEVLAWANEAIAALEGLVMVCILSQHRAFGEEAQQRLGKIVFDTAILVERGRIFFKNKPHGNFGIEKKPAYRGLRPRVLDPLIAANHIAIQLPDAGAEERQRMQCLAEDNLKDFVSLIQSEIGREKTASLVTQEGGSGFSLETALAGVSKERLARVRKGRKTKPGLQASPD